jgi:hypothetical protein
VQSFRAVQEFSGIPADFWAMLLDLDYVRAFNAAAGIDVEVLREERSGMQFARDIRYRSHKPVPVLLKPLMPHGIGYLETSLFDAARGEYQHRLTPVPLGKLAEMSATMRLELTGSERFVRIYEGTVTVRAPLIGGRLEREAVQALEKDSPEMMELTKTWLAKYTERRRAAEAPSPTESPLPVGEG